MSNEVKKAFIGAIKPLYRSFPILVGAILLVSLASTLVPKTFYSFILKGNIILDPFLAAILGSIFAGNPIISYVFGGELLDLGISLVAVTAFIVSWVTVGIIQLPAEILMLGRKFTIIRNILSFIFSIIVAIITILILGVILWKKMKLA